ncbi:MAG: hypothetical protein EA358_05580 [Flavobacteriales bacterium]|nr:MAG: hypothetical protein EA358_05580 [Flavobacteriales bacterium]
MEVNIQGGNSAIHSKKPSVFSGGFLVFTAQIFKTSPMRPRPRLQRKARRLKRQLVPADKSDGRSSLSAVAPTAVLAEDLQRKARLGAQKQLQITGL